MFTLVVVRSGCCIVGVSGCGGCVGCGCSHVKLDGDTGCVPLMPDAINGTFCCG